MYSSVVGSFEAGETQKLHSYRQLEVITWKLFERNNRKKCGTSSECSFHIRALSLRRFRKTNKFNRVLWAALLFLLWTSALLVPFSDSPGITLNKLFYWSLVQLRFLASRSKKEKNWPKPREASNFLGYTSPVVKRKSNWKVLHCNKSAMLLSSQQWNLLEVERNKKFSN